MTTELPPEPAAKAKAKSIAVALAQTIVIIPARNEEGSIGKVLAELPAVGRAIVVDNGSTDRTAEIAAAGGAMVVPEPIAGYGRACLTGIAHATENAAAWQVDLQYIAFLDGDYSDYPEQLSELMGPLAGGAADFVLGSRLAGNRERGAMPAQSVYGNKLAVFLIWLFWGYRFTDLGPFRVIRRQSLDELQMADVNFGWTVEMQIKAVVARQRIVELPVNYRCRVGQSKISGTISGTFCAGYKILFTIAKYRWKTL